MDDKETGMSMIEVFEKLRGQRATPKSIVDALGMLYSYMLSFGEDLPVEDISKFYAWFVETYASDEAILNAIEAEWPDEDSPALYLGEQCNNALLDEYLAGQFDQLSPEATENLDSLFAYIKSMHGAKGFSTWIDGCVTDRYVEDTDDYINKLTDEERDGVTREEIEDYLYEDAYRTVCICSVNSGTLMCTRETDDGVEITGYRFLRGNITPMSAKEVNSTVRIANAKVIRAPIIFRHVEEIAV